jgi:hypothetical protein
MHSFERKLLIFLNLPTFLGCQKASLALAGKFKAHWGELDLLLGPEILEIFLFRLMHKTV